MNKWIIYILIAANIVTFLIYGCDKFCAKRGCWRIPERVLLGLALLGGSAGALLGMKVFRHKTRHRKFTILVPLFLVLHIIIAMCLLGHSTGCLQM